MSESKLIELGYYDPSAKIRLSAYADTVVLDPDKKGSVICAIRFGGYPEMVRAMADAIYGGATIEATQNDMVRKLQSKLKGYQRQITHDGVYAVATLMAADDAQEEISPQDEDGPEDDRQKGAEEVAPQKPAQPRKCYIFCPEGDRVRLFEELDHKTAAPLIPAFQDYVLTSLQNRGDLRQLEVISQKERIDAWVLTLKPEDKNVVEVLEEGLKTGDIQIPGTVPGFSDGFEKVNNVTEYLNTFGVTVAARIRNQFMPLFDPASEPLSDEVLAINDFVTQHAGYSLYDAQLAVAEAVKRQLERKRFWKNQDRIDCSRRAARTMGFAEEKRHRKVFQHHYVPLPRYEKMGARDRRNAPGYLRYGGKQYYRLKPPLCHVRAGRQECVRGLFQGTRQRRLYARPRRTVEQTPACISLPGLRCGHRNGYQRGWNQLYRAGGPVFLSQREQAKS